MADDVQRTTGSYGPVRVRPEELVRPAEKRREFRTREAQRYLQTKERPRWALIAYAVFLAAMLLIFGITYTTYAFSKYRGVILPGVHVDGTSLSGLTQTQAENLIERQLAAIYNAPISLVSGQRRWKPTGDEIGVRYYPQATVRVAERVGRQGSFLEQLIDRLPIHPDHPISLQYTLNEPTLRAYIQRMIGPKAYSPTTNAQLAIQNYHVVLKPSQPGQVVDVQGTERQVESVLDSLSKQTRAVPVTHLRPIITDAQARQDQTKVENFLSHPPVIAVGKRVFVTSRVNFAPAFSFKNQTGGKQPPTIIVNVDANKVDGLVSWMASQVDQQSENAQLTFSAGRVHTISPMKLGRILDQQDAARKLLAVINALKPNARLHFIVHTTRPPIDETNPASLGIITLVGVGETSFIGAGNGRLQDIQTVASKLNEVLIKPDDQISFNDLLGNVGLGWPTRFYEDQERDVGGQIVPGRGGAMQQLATTFFRALYTTGLRLVERRNHVHRFSWYEPPDGMDAVVSPGGDDLVFQNNTHQYLLLETRVEPLRQELYVYVYGPNLRWKVAVGAPKTLKTYPAPPQLMQQDSSLSPGDVQQKAFAHDGAWIVVQRTITYPNGNVSIDRVKSYYQPWRAIYVVGTLPTPTPTPKPTSTPKGLRATGTPTTPTPGLPGPTPTPTFSH